MNIKAGKDGTAHFTSFQNAAPRHPAAQDPHPLLRQQDGHEGRHVVGQGLADSRAGAHHGQGADRSEKEMQG